MAPSDIFRFYHSVALLLPDGSVLVAGSEQGICIGNGCLRASPPYPQRQAEKFKPQYFFGAAAARRPRIVFSTVPASGRLGSYIEVSYLGEVDGAVLAAPAAVTHQFNTNQRVVKLVTRPGGMRANGWRSRFIGLPPASGTVALPGYVRHRARNARSGSGPAL
jgi:hypothetical protein